ncbi:MAG: hypothetical protein ABSC48_15155 [Terracidiphilus sp.]|jgi:hypothetical protein
MRSVISGVLVFVAVSTVPLCASGFDDKIPDQQSIDALEIKARQAPSHEQCFLYAKLVHQMTELSVRQYAAGDVEKAAELLRQVQELTHKIHLSMADDNKRLKYTEILLRHTAFRLTGMLRSSNIEDQSLVAQTLAQVNQVQSEAMLQVFRK